MRGFGDRKDDDGGKRKGLNVESGEVGRKVEK